MTRLSAPIAATFAAALLSLSGDASAADIEGLGEEIRRRVKQQSGITLEWEIRRIGRRATCPTALARGCEGGAS